MAKSPKNILTAAPTDPMMKKVVKASTKLNKAAASASRKINASTKKAAKTVVSARGAWKAGPV